SSDLLAVQYLFLHIKKSLDTIRDQTIAALFSVLQSQHHDSQKQVFFLYKEAADALIHIAIDITHPLSLKVVSSLQELLVTTVGKKNRAVSEALGYLPLNITGPDIEVKHRSDSIPMDFNACLVSHGIQDAYAYRWQGRTLIYSLNNGTMLCIKFARTKKNQKDLMREAEWLSFLNANPPCCESIFYIPVPIPLHDQYIIKLEQIPDFILTNKEIYPGHLAIIFISEKDYFHYVNEPCHFHNQAPSIKEVYRRNAWLLGRLTSMGIIHTAIIPLFHNRAQQSRRQDQGVYIWEQGGRLDKWLESCRYPNFAKSGLRDFEHLESLKNTKELRHFIGEHLLGFILVMGSFFRNKEPEKKGFDENGNPLDLRSLFDKALFIELVTEVVQQYYQGVTGRLPKNISRFLNETLIDKLIENMGVDHHMEEILRIQDQINMDQNDFETFLISRGYDESLLKTVHKGEKDIILNTGPHLGGFNQSISVPELIELLFCLSSLCVSDRFIMENGLKACRN
ncbi:MAG: SidJ-related pseudokinase, partial [Desulfobacula sp.]